MGFMSRLGIESKGMFFFSLFYLIAGIMNLVVLGMHGLNLPHLSIIAILSIATAFGLFKLQRWSIWLVVGLFFIATTYGGVMLNAFLGRGSSLTDYLAIAAWILYLLLTWIATLYVAVKRRSLR